MSSAGYARMTVGFSDPLRIVNLRFRIRQLSFDEAGTYLFALTVDDHEVAARRVVCAANVSTGLLFPANRNAREVVGRASLVAQGSQFGTVTFLDRLIEVRDRVAPAPRVDEPFGIGRRTPGLVSRAGLDAPHEGTRPGRAVYFRCLVTSAWPAGNEKIPPIERNTLRASSLGRTIP